MSYAYDADARTGTLVFDAVPGVTEVAVPARLFPAGVDAQLTGVAGCWSHLEGTLAVQTTEAGRATVTFGPAL